MKARVAILVLVLTQMAPAQDSGSVPQRLCPTCGLQASAALPEHGPQSATPQAQTEPPEMALVADLPHPEKYAVAFLPLEPGHSNESVAFLVAPNGKVGTVPMAKLGDAAKAGYRPFTVGDLLAITNAVVEEETSLQKRYKELSEDYNALVQRFNRLAAVNATTPVQTLPVVDEREAMRLMLFQAWVKRAFTPPAAPIQVQTVDCTKFPALCVTH